MSSILSWSLSILRDAGSKLLGGVLAGAIALWLASRGIHLEQSVRDLLDWLAAPERRILVIVIGAAIVLALVTGSVALVVRWRTRRGFPSAAILRQVRQLARELETICLAPVPDDTAEEVLKRFRDQHADLSGFHGLAPLLAELADQTDQYMLACAPYSGIEQFAERHHLAATEALSRFRAATVWVVDNEGDQRRAGLKQKTL